MQPMFFYGPKLGMSRPLRGGRAATTHSPEGRINVTEITEKQISVFLRAYYGTSELPHLVEDVRRGLTAALSLPSIESKEVVKAITLDVLRNYFKAMDAGDVPDQALALYSYLLMDGYIGKASAAREVRSALSAPTGNEVGTPAPVEGMTGWIYDPEHPMSDGGDTRMTAAEEVLAYLLVEVNGSPDDVPYSPNDAQRILEDRLREGKRLEESYAAFLSERRAALAAIEREGE